MKKLIILASGSGTNAENLVRYFKKHPAIEVDCVLTNRPKAAVLTRCDRLNVAAFYFNKHAFAQGHALDHVKCIDPDLVVLAGFLWKIPKDWIAAFPHKIVNIHPALLPKHGGKGMYGQHVHHAVKKNNDTETGITIHYVNENYDEGNIIFQAKVAVFSGDSVDAISEKVQKLEYEHYPKIIEKLLKNG